MYPGGIHLTRLLARGSFHRTSRELTIVVACLLMIEFGEHFPPGVRARLHQEPVIFLSDDFC
jgi:hypothetical protein